MMRTTFFGGETHTASDKKKNHNHHQQEQEERTHRPSRHTARYEKKDDNRGPDSRLIERKGPTTSATTTSVFQLLLAKERTRFQPSQLQAAASSY